MRLLSAFGADVVGMPECEPPLAVAQQPGIRIATMQGFSLIRRSLCGHYRLVTHYDNHVPVEEEFLGSTLELRIADDSLANELEKLLLYR